MDSDVGEDGPRWISADSHLVEPPDLFRNRLPRAMRDDAPHVERLKDLGDAFVIPGLTERVPLGFARPAAQSDGTAAGARAELSDLRPGGSDPIERLADQALDGVGAEVLYPTVGLVLFRQPDPALRRACARGYNEWLAEVCAAAPDRLLGVAMVAPLDAASAAEEVRRAEDAGAAGLLLPTRPDGPDYGDPCWAPLFDAMVASGLPLSFHAIGGPRRPGRGSALARLATQPHEAQELLATLVFAGVLDAWPDLQVVLAEFDVGWVDHLVDRMDRLAEVHAGWGAVAFDRRPSEMVASQVHFAFATDLGALATLRHVPPERLLWGNDYPHAEGTWPRSGAVVAAQAAGVPPAVVAAFTHGNAARLYDLVPGRGVGSAAPNGRTG